MVFCDWKDYQIPPQSDLKSCGYVVVGFVALKCKSLRSSPDKAFDFPFRVRSTDRVGEVAKTSMINHMNELISQT